MLRNTGGSAVVALTNEIVCTQVKIMKDYDPTGRRGPKMPLPDVVKVIEPKVCSRKLALQRSKQLPARHCLLLVRLCAGGGDGVRQALRGQGG